MAHVLLPTRGEVTYPAELRVRYIPSEPLLWKGTLLLNFPSPDSKPNPLFYEGSLMFNLRFGNMNKSRQHSDEEIWAVWKLLGGHPKYIGANDFHVGINGSKLGLADRVLVALARALLSSVDFLLLASTLDALGEVRSFHEASWHPLLNSKC